MITIELVGFVDPDHVERHLRALLFGKPYYNQKKLGIITPAVKRLYRLEDGAPLELLRISHSSAIENEDEYKDLLETLNAHYIIQFVPALYADKGTLHEMLRKAGPPF